MENDTGKKGGRRANSNKFMYKVTPDKFDPLRRSWVDSRITSVDMLKEVVSQIYDKAVLDPTFCPRHAVLFSDLRYRLPSFPSEEPDGKKITFLRLLLNMCQETFEGAEKLRQELEKLSGHERADKERFLKIRTLGNMKFIGELQKQKMIPIYTSRHILEELLGTDPKECPAEENVEALCAYLNTIGKFLDGFEPKIRIIFDGYYSRLEEFTTSPLLTPSIRILLRDLLDLRSSNWVPRREEIKGKGKGKGKAKAITEIHSKEKRFSVRLRARETTRAWFLVLKGVPAPSWREVIVLLHSPGWNSWTSLPLRRLGLVPRFSAKKTVSLLDEYFVIRSLDKVLACVEELKSPAFHPEFVKEAVCRALENGPPIVEPTVELFEHLCTKKVVAAGDIVAGCLLYAPRLEDLGVDFPRAHPSFGEILGGLVLSGCVDFKVVKEAIEKVGAESGYRPTIFDGVTRVINASPDGQEVLESQSSDVNACQDLL